MVQNPSITSRSFSIRHKAAVLFVLLVVLSVSLYAFYNKGQSSHDNETGLNTDVSAGDWYSVYFTNPGSPNSLSYRGGPEEHLAAAIDQARLSIEIAIYDFDLWRLRDALLAAEQRGVVVRFLCDGNNLAKPDIQALHEAGIAVKGSRGYGLMHHKFVIIDRREVWTGSMNFTRRGAYLNNNNLLRIRSPLMTQNFLVEFEEMYINGQFGSGSPKNTPHSTFSVDGTLLEVYFSPEDGVESQIVRMVAGAEESIYFLAYSFTSNTIAEAIIERVQSGVTVAGVLERTQFRSNVGSEYLTFTAAGIDIRLDGNPRNMHHKVMIIDEQIVVTGSYNFSSGAELRNDENTIFIHNEDIARLYLGEFERVFNEASQ